MLRAQLSRVLPLVCVIGSLVLGATAQAVTFDVDFNTGGGSPTQAGFQAYNALTTNDQTQTFATGFGGAMVDVRLKGPGAVVVDTRDRGNTMGDAAALGRDFVFIFGPGAFNVELTGLPAGAYRLTTYHNDSSTSVDAPNITVSDAYAANDLRVTGLSISTSGSPSFAGIERGETFISSDGVNPIVLSLFNGDKPSINGFTLDNSVPADLRVDYGAVGQDVEPGFIEISSGTVAGSIARTLLSDVGNFGVVDVEFTNTGNIEFRKQGDSGRPNITGTLGQMAEDFLFGRGDDSTLTLSNLRSGLYMMTTYHNDSVNGVNADLDVMLTDAKGLHALGVVDQSATTNVANIAALSFMFEADGLNDVTLSFHEIAGNLTALNGFELVRLSDRPVPEPATAAALVIGALALVRRRRRA